MSVRAAVSALVAVAAVLASLLLASAAGAVQRTLTATAASNRDCTTAERSGPSVAGAPVSSPALSEVTARLSARSGDWDLAILDRASGRVVAGSASLGADEVAQGFALAGERLLVQACRRSGSDRTAEVTTAFQTIPSSGGQTTQLVAAQVADREAQARLQALGLDLAEAGGPGYISVVLHGAQDAAALRAAGFDYEVQVADLAAQAARERRADRRYASATRASELPSGRTTYRRLFDYAQEMKQLAMDNPGLVRPITLSQKTYEGRDVEGIEITTDADNRRDGKPVFLQMGAHHAREWPSAEHAMEWAYELIDGYKSGAAPYRDLVSSTRTIVIPVVNPDGFNASREAGEAQGHGGGQGGDDIQNFASSPIEYRRKNCRFVDDSEGGSCTQPSVGLAEPGVDPNRNYGGFWGGPGASTDQTAQDYRGPGPFSEPETENIRRLVSNRQVVTMITNHTFSDLVLRPPGIASQGDPFDETIYKALGDAMAAQNGYTSQKSFELYDTTGTTEDWSYYATGGLGFTFEIGCNLVDPADPASGCEGNFHPPFEQVVAQYTGTSPEAQAIGGGGNRAAYLLAQQNTADNGRHSVLTGEAPPGAVLKIEKSFQTPTSPQPDESGEPIMLDDHLESELKVGDSGDFEWDINPSTRPLVAQDRGRQALGSPSDPITFSGAPGGGATPCASFETDDPACFNDHPFEVPGGDGVDNESATVSIDWASPASDWDLKVFRDVDGDGTSENETPDDEVGQSAGGAPASAESATFVDPQTGDGRLEPGKYVARVINFAAVDPYDGEVGFAGPDEFKAGTTESWTLTCSLDGRVGVSQQVTIARGESQQLSLTDPCLRGLNIRCGGRLATVVGTKANDELRGTKGADVIAGQEGRDKIKGRGGKDVICASGGKDKVKAGGGKDRVKGGGGKDRLKGNGGKDRLSGGKGKDTLEGGGGRDKLNGGGGKDRLEGGGGRDKLNGGGGRDRCAGGPGKDRLRSCARGG